MLRAKGGIVTNFVCSPRARASIPTPLEIEARHFFFKLFHQASIAKSWWHPAKLRRSIDSLQQRFGLLNFAKHDRVMRYFEQSQRITWKPPFSLLISGKSRRGGALQS